MENVYLQQEMLFTKMPRDPDNKRYRAMHDIHDKVQFLTGLFERHQGEIREVCGYWNRVATALPNKGDSPAWYTLQYSEGTHFDSVNAFLRRGRQSDEHFVKRSWVSSLPHLVKVFGATFSAESIYEMYIALEVVVTKKKRSRGSGSNPQ